MFALLARVGEIDISPPETTMCIEGGRRYMVRLSRPIVLGIDVLVSKQTVKYKHWLAGIDCLIIWLHRWLRNMFFTGSPPLCCYPPHRWLRKFKNDPFQAFSGYPPHRWLRKACYSIVRAKKSYPPHRWLRNLNNVSDSS